MIADWLLQILGNNPAAYPQADDKWAAIAADLIDLLVPVVIVVLFFLPLLIIKLRHKKFTALNVIIAILIGAALAYGAYWLNEWSYGYGQGVIFNQIYGG